MDNSGVLTILFGTSSGALSAKLTNGNVWQGAATGFFVSALNHAAHKIKVRDMVMENLDAMGKNPRDIPEYSEDSVHDLIKRDSTLSEMNQNAKNPKVEVGGVYGRSKTAAGATDGFAKTKTVNYIGYNKGAFKSYYNLYHTIGHELTHAIQIVSGQFHYANITYGKEKAMYLMEADAYGWNYSMSPSNMQLSQYQRNYLIMFYGK